MKFYTKKEVIKEEKVLDKITCDTCEIEINESNHDFYFEVTTGHSRWGVDSDGSLERLDFCSYDCLSKNMDSYYNSDEAGHTSSYDVKRLNLKRWL